MAWTHDRILIDVQEEAPRNALAKEAAHHGWTVAELERRGRALNAIDDDTLTARIFLQPRHWVKEKLRLRDLDGPEIAAAEGRAARGLFSTRRCPMPATPC